MLRRALGLTTAGGTAACAYAYYEAKQRMGADAVARIVSYDIVAVPAIVEYKWLEAKCEKLPKVLPSLFPPVSDEEERAQFQVLHRKWAKPLFDKFMELGGFYYKSGQKIASNMSGVVPEYYSEMFQPFLNNIPPRDIREVRAVMEADMGKPVEDMFSSFDETPIGCASIGQTHRAVLRATGERVVVKVMNPEAERTFRGDVFALKVLVDAFMPQASPAFDEIAKQFATEFDYTREAQNAIDVRANLEASPFRDKVVVPKVHAQLCSKRVMVMEEIWPSTPLHHALDEQAALLARQAGMSKEAFLRTEKARIDREAHDAAKHGRLVRQLSTNTYDKYIAVQRTRRAVVSAWRSTWNATVGLLARRWRYESAVASDDVLVPINAARLIDDLLAVHGYEVLVNGCFNADPHPGNVLYTDGKLGLIDYGQVKRLSDEERLSLARFLLLVDAAIKIDPRTDAHADPAAHVRARAAIAKAVFDLGVKTEKMDVDVAYEMNVVYYGRMDAAWLYPRNVLQWTDWMESRDPMKDISSVEHVIMVNMVGMMLRGLGEMLQQSRNLAVCWRPFARQALQEKGLLEGVEAEIATWFRDNGEQAKPARSA